MNSKNTLLADFPAFVAGRETADALRRAEAAKRFAVLGLPGRDREAWKYNDLKPLAAADFRPVGDPGAVDPAAAATRFTPGLAAHRLAFVDGVHSPELSDGAAPPAGVRLLPLAAAAPSDLAGAGLGRLADTADAAFAALNSAWWRDGLFLDLAEGAALERPLELLFLASASSAGRMISPRLLMRAGRGSRATIIESYAGFDDEPRLINTVGEFACGEHSEIQHVKLMRDGGGTWHLGASHVAQAAGSRYLSREIILGGAMTRRELQLSLNGAGADCDLNALYLGDGEQRQDLRTRVRHAVPDCNTRELYKGILDGRSRGIFDGLIEVARDAQRTAAYQINRNLLLSKSATANSMPRLEIYADDVKCSHGSTTGQIDEEQLFYLRTRGFDPDSARALLTYAFAREIVESISEEALRRALAEELLARLPRSDLIAGSL